MNELVNIVFHAVTLVEDNYVETLGDSSGRGTRVVDVNFVLYLEQGIFRRGGIKVGTSRDLCLKDRSHEKIQWVEIRRGGLSLLAHGEGGQIRLAPLLRHISLVRPAGSRTINL